jgi:hypothetical protein
MRGMREAERLGERSTKRCGERSGAGDKSKESRCAGGNHAAGAEENGPMHGHVCVCIYACVWSRMKNMECWTLGRMETGSEEEEW